MPFTLRIHFSGLCLFVPRRDTSNRMRMHVLMANATQGHHHGTRHFPVLRFDTAHLRPNQAGTDKVTAYRDLSRMRVEIGSAEASDVICPQIVRLREVTNRDVPDRMFQNSPGTAALGARVTVADGAMTLVGRGKCWEWAPGQAQRMAHFAIWEISMPTADELRLRLDPLGSGTALELPVLYPIGAAAEPKFINLSVHHLPADELAPVPAHHATPGNGEPAWHFASYYDLYESLPHIRLPRFAGDACVLPENPCPEEATEGPSSFNCMLGSGA